MRDTYYFIFILSGLTSLSNDHCSLPSKNNLKCSKCYQNSTPSQKSIFQDKFIGSCDCRDFKMRKISKEFEIDCFADNAGRELCKM